MAVYAHWQPDLVCDGSLASCAQTAWPLSYLMASTHDAQSTLMHSSTNL